MAAAKLNDPNTGQFHGTVCRRRELETAVMVETEPNWHGLPYKTPHYHAHPYFWMLLKGDVVERVQGQPERNYEPFTLTYHPKGEVHAHEQGPRSPSGFAIVMIEPMFD